MAPFPPGYEPDPDVLTVDLTRQPGPEDVVVITRSTTTEQRGTRETVKAAQLPAGITEEALCTLAGANYDNLTRGTYNPRSSCPTKPRSSRDGKALIVRGGTPRVSPPMG